MSALTIELIADVDEGGYTARLPDVPAYGEGDTQDLAIADLRLALKAYVEVFGLQDLMDRIVQPELRQADWDLKELSRA